MALTPLPGAGWWVPRLGLAMHAADNFNTNVDSGILDADGEELQIIGTVETADDLPHTFGLSSKIDWQGAPSITFASGSTVRVGVKKSTRLDVANGPPARATIGAAAFDVYDDLIGGTDTITSSAWRSDTMTAGTPFTLTPGDGVALCVHLTTSSGSPSVKVRLLSPSVARLTPGVTLVTSGPTYTAITAVSSMLLTFDDGALGWVLPSATLAQADNVPTAPGSGNILANIIRLPYTVQIDALAALPTPASATANWALDLYSTPLGTPALMASVTQDAHLLSATAQRIAEGLLPTPQTLAGGVDYAIGLRQLTASGVQVGQRTVNSAAYWPMMALDDTCYGATSTAGATFADAVATHRRRYHIWMRICAIETGRRQRARAFTGF